jgi:hypothetical protein
MFVKQFRVHVRYCRILTGRLFYVNGYSVFLNASAVEFFIEILKWPFDFLYEKLLRKACSYREPDIGGEAIADGAGTHSMTVSVTCNVINKMR